MSLFLGGGCRGGGIGFVFCNLVSLIILPDFYHSHNCHLMAEVTEVFKTQVPKTQEVLLAQSVSVLYSLFWLTQNTNNMQAFSGSFSFVLMVPHCVSLIILRVNCQN